MKRIKTILSAAAAAGLVLLCRPDAYAAARTYVDNTVDTSRNTAAIAAALVIIVLIFVGLAAVVRMGKSGHLNVPWAVLSVLLAHEPGVLSALLSCISAVGGSVLTITQSLPIHGKASVTITLDISGMQGSITELLEALSQVDGAENPQLIAIE